MAPQGGHRGAMLQRAAPAAQCVSTVRRLRAPHGQEPPTTSPAVRSFAYQISFAGGAKFRAKGDLVVRVVLYGSVDGECLAIGSLD
jgi:hypothetical protein